MVDTIAAERVVEMPTSASKIIGGSAANPGEFSSAVAMQIPVLNNTARTDVCTKNFIHLSIVLSAAHCTTNASALYFGEKFIDLSNKYLPVYTAGETGRKIELPPI